MKYRQGCGIFALRPVASSGLRGHLMAQLAKLQGVAMPAPDAPSPPIGAPSDRSVRRGHVELGNLRGRSRILGAGASPLAVARRSRSWGALLRWSSRMPGTVLGPPADMYRDWVRHPPGAAGQTECGATQAGEKWGAQTAGDGWDKHDRWPAEGAMPGRSHFLFGTS